jgi:hypothetical protein
MNPRTSSPRVAQGRWAAHGRWLLLVGWFLVARFMTAPAGLVAQVLTVREIPHRGVMDAQREPG